MLVLDDCLHLVPFDALPVAASPDVCLGDVLRIETRASLGELRAEITRELERSIANAESELRQARKAEDDVARQRGFLVLKTEMRARLVDIWAPLNAALQAIPAKIGRRHNLPDSVVRDIRALISVEQRETHRRLVEILGAFAPPPEDGDDAAEAA